MVFNNYATQSFLQITHTCILRLKTNNGYEPQHQTYTALTRQMYAICETNFAF
jgi:hypothetical protein